MDTNIVRRDFLKAGGIGTLFVSAFPLAAKATPDDAMQAIEKIIGAKTPKDERVNLVLTEIAENGGTVPLKVSVESPMSPEDHVKALHILTDGNGNPLGFHLTGGQVHATTVLDAVMMTANNLGDESLPVAWPVAVGGDKGYRAEWIDTYLLNLGINTGHPVESE